MHGQGGLLVAFLLILQEVGALGAVQGALVKGTIINGGDTVFLKVRKTGACITLQEDNGENWHSSVHAKYHHHGLWQSLTIEKANRSDKSALNSGSTIFLRGHTGKYVEVIGQEVEATQSARDASQALLIEKEWGEGPIAVGDAVYVRAASSGRWLGIEEEGAHVLVHARSASKGPWQAFVMDEFRPGPFDGRWTLQSDPGTDVFVIKGDAMHFVDDFETSIIMQSGNSFTTGLHGWSAHSSGELSDGKIVWSNGDVWIPTKGPFDGRWTPGDDPGKKIFHIRGDMLRVVGGAESVMTTVSEDKFTTDEPEAPDSMANLVGINLHWGNGDVWVPLAAGRFDGRWVVKANPGGDFFDIEGDMLFFDAGLESRIVRDGDSFTTELQGEHSHVKATLSADRQELHWNNGDVWTRFHKDGRDFWVPPSVLAATATRTATTATSTTTVTTATVTNTITVTTATVTSTITVTTATVTSQTTTTATTAVTITQATPMQTTNDTAIATATSPTEGACFEQQVAYEPLDMDKASASYENSALDCQRRCQRTHGCTHFTYWFLVQPGHCHLQDVYALHSGFRLGFVAGPASCYKNVTGRTKNGLVKLNQPEVGNQTYVPYAYRCLKMSRTYAPIMHSEFLTKETGYLKGRQAVKGCRELCLKTKGCAYYSIGFPARLCSLSPEHAHEVRYIIKHISGPVSCDVEDQHDVQKWENASNASNASNATSEFLELQDLEVNTATGRQPASVQLLGCLGVGLCAVLVALVMLKRTVRWRHSLAATGDTSERKARMPSKQEHGDKQALLTEEGRFAVDGFAE